MSNTKASLVQGDGSKELKFRFKPKEYSIQKYATANIALEEVPDEPKGTNPTSGSLAGRRTYVVGAGDSLHSVAFAEYGDPSLWRALAVFNGVDDPLRVTAGIRLLLPSADEARAMV